MTTTEYTTIRKSLGTQSDVAELLDVSERTLRSIENGTKPITDDDANALRALVAATEPDSPPPVARQRLDSTPRQPAMDTLTANILHWYVEPGYVWKTALSV